MPGTKIKGKKNIILQNTFKKGEFAVDESKSELLKMLSQDSVTIEMHKAGKNDDGTEFLLLRFDNLKP